MDQPFSPGASSSRQSQTGTSINQHDSPRTNLTPLYAGLSVIFNAAFLHSIFPLSVNVHAVHCTIDDVVAVAVAIRDATQLIDFTVKQITPSAVGQQSPDAITRLVLSELEQYARANGAKFIAAGVHMALLRTSPRLGSSLWLDLDICPVYVIPDEATEGTTFSVTNSIREQADCIAQSCFRRGGGPPPTQPKLVVLRNGNVLPTPSFAIQAPTTEWMTCRCGPSTRRAMIKYLDEFCAKDTKLAFFSNTIEGGGIAAMRLELVRFASVMQVGLEWYVPSPDFEVFKITRKMQNILQGVSRLHEFVSPREKQLVTDWIAYIADRYWFSTGGPLRRPEDGGANVIVIDNHQLAGLIPMIKKKTPDRPVLYRSHLHLRANLIAQGDSPQADVWEFLWSSIRHADMFISHPVLEFVPQDVPKEKVVYLPASTDWLNERNKRLKERDVSYYLDVYNQACRREGVAELHYPAKKYIAQVGRFDVAKGIPDVIEAYAEFRQLCDEKGVGQAPQLVVCGNQATQDPDSLLVFINARNHMMRCCHHLVGDISFMCLERNDRILNAIVSKAHVVLQLSRSEGFEVAVSEALHAGRPVIVTKAGGMPLQVKANVNSFLVEPGDTKAVAQHLLELFTDEALHRRMSAEAAKGISHEIGTMGNVLGWAYLACKWAGGGRLEGNERWVNDMAREEAGYPYQEGESRLPREYTARETKQ